ncbi:MAG: hypothetical protein JXO72_06520 [Vicinamibacteria bacterium]|nr:hypothetical protein [Vicinamibacteria bacterium]
MIDRKTLFYWTGWVAWTAVALIALGGAASQPEGISIGTPRPLAAAAAIVCGVALSVWTRRNKIAWGLGLLPIPLALMFCRQVSGFAAFTGFPLLALSGSVVVLALWRAQVRISGRAFFLCILAVYLVVAARAQKKAGPEGDEPHYLIVADSLLHDGDLEVEREFRERRYRRFTSRDIEPHYIVRGREGEIYSVHAIGLSLLILPAYAIGGYPAASFFMAFLAALLAWEIREMIRRHTSRPGLATGVGGLVALSPPLCHYAGLIFTEAPAALIVCWSMRSLRDTRGISLVRRIAVGCAIAFLPWLNVRYAVFVPILLLYGLSGELKIRSGAALAAPSVISGLLVGVYHHVLYGFFDPRRIYGRRPEHSFTNVSEGLPGIFFDQEFGLLIYAPVFAMAMAGMILLFRRHFRLAMTSALLSLSVLITVAPWHMWRGGWNPPARFIVPLVAILALALSEIIGRGPRVAVALFAGWSLWTGIGGMFEPRLVHRDRDGTAPFFRASSGALEWTMLLPSYVAPPDERAYDRAWNDRDRLSLVWGAALLIGTLTSLRRRPRLPEEIRTAAAVILSVIAAGASSCLSTGRSEGRDAVRLIERNDVFTSGRAMLANTARWGTDSLLWGPTYEPHRFPSGAVIGGRLPLPPGRYLLELKAEGPSGSVDPRIELRTETPRRPPARRIAASLHGNRWSFEVMTDEVAVTLALKEGGPLIVREIRLKRLICESRSSLRSGHPEFVQSRSLRREAPMLGSAGP